MCGTARKGVEQVRVRIADLAHVAFVRVRLGAGGSHERRVRLLGPAAARVRRGDAAQGSHDVHVGDSELLPRREVSRRRGRGDALGERVSERKHLRRVEEARDSASCVRGRGPRAFEECYPLEGTTRRGGPQRAKRVRVHILSTKVQHERERAPAALRTKRTDSSLRPFLSFALPRRREWFPAGCRLTKRV